ncbi:MAG: LacI family transcriptional regulator [Hyphomicrobiales bacterium]|nr:LacI family transcriptional regulator [Hyphomicrobiales bacterium]
MTADRPRIRDVAALAETSVSTVSNFLNDRPERMRPETMQRIEAAISQLGYRRSGPARHLKTGFVPMLGLLVPSVANPSHGAMARAVEVAAEAQGLQVVLGNTQRDPVREKRYASQFLDLGIRGIIISSSPFTLDHFTQLIADGLVIVAIDLGATVNGIDLPIDSVSFDNRKAGYLATRTLIENGHTKIGYVSATTPTVSRQERFQGYKDALLEANLHPHPSPVSAPVAAFGFDDTNAVEHGEAAARELLAAVPKLTGIVAINDMHAIGACAALNEVGLRVPEDVSVVGIDDVQISKFVDPPLTTVYQPFELLGSKAFELLDNRIRYGFDGPPQHLTFPPHVVSRKSIAKPNSRA